MRQETWSKLDREIRTRAADALAGAGFAYQARELRAALPIDSEASALAVCHLATQLGGELRGELHAQARSLLMSVSLAAYCVYRGWHRQAATYMATIKTVARAMSRDSSSEVAS